MKITKKHTEVADILFIPVIATLVETKANVELTGRVTQHCARLGSN
jgi:hypothetical protein